MPAYLLICRDKPDAGALRADTRDAHLAFIEAHKDVFWLAGPMLSGNDTPIGSLLIIDAADAEAAAAFAAQDPYAQAGLFEDVEVRPYRFVKGKFLGGA